eukprot:7172205-Prorocentrum_lima.AAC.1
MTSSLVGSEMCIRDRGWSEFPQCNVIMAGLLTRLASTSGEERRRLGGTCLLYTSDAADDM